MQELIQIQEKLVKENEELEALQNSYICKEIKAPVLTFSSQSSEELPRFGETERVLTCLKDVTNLSQSLLE